ncbi:uncharacterized, partial [Tachysurus ichikawai]
FPQEIMAYHLNRRRFACYGFVCGTPERQRAKYATVMMTMKTATEMVNEKAIGI